MGLVANVTVAMAGATGGRPDTALFFAIRHNGTPIKATFG